MWGRYKHKQTSSRNAGLLIISWPFCLHEVQMMRLCRSYSALGWPTLAGGNTTVGRDGNWKAYHPTTQGTFFCSLSFIEIHPFFWLQQLCFITVRVIKSVSDMIFFKALPCFLKSQILFFIFVLLNSTAICEGLQ
jgi:hypothetical protein